MEVARVNLQFRKVNRDGEITLVRSHQALATLRLPQPIRGGHSILSAMDLKLVTMMHLLLKGESFWGLADRMKVSGSPTKVNVYNLGFVRACKIGRDGYVGRRAAFISFYPQSVLEPAGLTRVTLA